MVSTSMQIEFMSCFITTKMNAVALTSVYVLTK